MSNYIYKWSFSDSKNRDLKWYIVTISIVLGLFLWWIIYKQYWFSFIIVLLFWVMLFIDNNSPEDINVEIKELWISINNNFYDYNKINGFETIYDWENITYIRLLLNQRWIKNLDLRINNETYSEAKEILINFLWEPGSWELSKSDKLINLLKL